MKFRISIYVCTLLVVLAGAAIIPLHQEAARPTAVAAQISTNSSPINEDSAPLIGLAIRQASDGNTVCLPLTKQQTSSLRARVEQSAANAALLDIPPDQLVTRAFVPAQGTPSLFTLRATAGLQANEQARAALQRAAARWGSILRGRPDSTPFNLTVDADFATTAFGAAFPSADTVVTTVFRPQPSLAGARTLGERLSDGSNYDHQRSIHQSFGFTLPTDLGTTEAYIGTRLTFIASGTNFNRPQEVHSLAFNSALNYDFDPSDGIGPDKLDFEALALRELGRFAGLISGTGVAEIAPIPGLAAVGLVSTWPSLWDFYRFRPGVNMDTFNSAQRIQRTGGEQVFFTGDLELPLSNGLADPNVLLSGGPVNFGFESRSSGHWKDDALTGQYLGIMDPTYASGERGAITANDVTALSYFGYAINPDTQVGEILSVDDNGREQTLPTGNALLVNRFTPERAPFNVESVRVQLPPASDGSTPIGKQLRVVVFADAARTSQPPANPVLLADRTITIAALPQNRMLEVMLTAPVTINGGDVYVGVQSPGSNLNFATDSNEPQGRSFVSTNNGTSFQPLMSNGAPVNAIVRASVNAQVRAMRNQPPELTALSTSAVAANQPLELTVFGQHFLPDSDDLAGRSYHSVIRVNGSNKTTTFLGPSMLRALVPATDTTGPNPVRITVYTITPNGGFESAPLELPITPNAPAPLLTRLDPATVAVATPLRRVLLYGRNFKTNTVASLNGQTRATRVLRDTQLEVTLLDGDLTQAGAANLSASTPAPGGGVSNQLTLNIAPCSYTIGRTERLYSADAAGSTVDALLLKTADHCPWMATSSAAWVKLEGLTSGFGTAPISFRVTNNNAQPARTATIQVAGQTFTLRQPPGLTVLSAASYQPFSAVGAIATIFGTELAKGTQSATTTPLPITLSGTKVMVSRTLEAPLFFVSPTQINFQIAPQGLIPPPEDMNRSVYSLLISVFVDGQVVAESLLPVANVVPSFFTADASGEGTPTGLVLRSRQGGGQAFEPLIVFDQALNRFVSRPIDLGPETDRVFLILFGTGFTRRSALTAASVTVGGVSAPVTFAGAQGSLVGVDQLNCELPRALKGRGELPLTCRIDGREANRLRVVVQ